MIRLPQTDEPPLDLFDGLTAELAETLIREELGESALFGLRFRQNAGRALLMPRPDPAKRTPLWLQRLRAKDLLQVARRVSRLPDRGRDLSRMPRRRPRPAPPPRLPRRGQAGTDPGGPPPGEIPSPFASELIFRFTRHTSTSGTSRSVATGRAVPWSTMTCSTPLLDPDAARAGSTPTRSAASRTGSAARATRRARPTRWPKRSAGWATSPAELAGPMLGFLRRARGRRAGRHDRAGRHGRAAPLDRRRGGALYESAFAEPADEDALATIVHRFLLTHALIGLDDLTARYPIDPVEATDLLERGPRRAGWSGSRRTTQHATVRWADRQNLDEVQRLSIALRRRESVAVRARGLRRLRRAAPARSSRHAAGGSRRRSRLVLEQLQGFAAPADLWESDLLPRRVRDYRPAWLDEALSAGGWLWRAGRRPGRAACRLRPARIPGAWPEPDEPADLSNSKRPACSITWRSEAHGSSPTWPSKRGWSRRGCARRLTDCCGRAGHQRPLRPAAARARQWPTPWRRLRRPRRQGTPAWAAPRPSARRLCPRPEGRWSLFPRTRRRARRDRCSPGPRRSGALRRPHPETAALDPWAPPWRELAPCWPAPSCAASSAAATSSRGSRVSSIATDEAAEDLARLAGDATGGSRPFLISTLDPANLYGAGAPFDIPLLEGGTAVCRGRHRTSWSCSAGGPS